MAGNDSQGYSGKCQGAVQIISRQYSPFLTARSWQFQIMIENVEFHEIRYADDRYVEACELRNEILRRPIGLDLYAEDLSREVSSRHFVLIQDGRVIAYLMITPVSEKVGKLRQMLVVEAFRGKGFGRCLVQSTEQTLVSSGLEQIVMFARVSAITFYEKLGYRRVSDEFLEVGIPHVTMQKNLQNQSISLERGAITNG